MSTRYKHTQACTRYTHTHMSSNMQIFYHTRTHFKHLRRHLIHTRTVCDTHKHLHVHTICPDSGLVRLLKPDTKNLMYTYLTHSGCHYWLVNCYTSTLIISLPLLVNACNTSLCVKFLSYHHMLEISNGHTLSTTHFTGGFIPYSSKQTVGKFSLSPQTPTRMISFQWRKTQMVKSLARFKLFILDM